MDGLIFLTQAELAKRWHASQSSVKNWRDEGLVPYFQLPGSSRVLYPLEQIEIIEKQFTRQTKEVKPKKPTEIKGKLPGISKTSKKVWRI
jgi:hypothetical protein